MLTEKKVLGLIGGIYDAAADERLWPAFLEEFVNAVDGEATGLVYHDMATLRADLAVSVRSDPEAETRYLNYYSTFDPLRKAWLERFRHASPEGVVTSEQMAPCT
jgi:hypothetical protein